MYTFTGLNNSESMISNYLDILSRLSINLSWKCCSNDESNDDDDDMDENIDNSDEQKYVNPFIFVFV